MLEGGQNAGGRRGLGGPLVRSSQPRSHPAAIVSACAACWVLLWAASPAHLLLRGSPAETHDCPRICHCVLGRN